MRYLAKAVLPGNSLLKRMREAIADFLDGFAFTAD
tara:strand:- start:296 stop:400 length:105 start_codon:yes stop_codon:yes gene_type:complete